MKQYTHKNRAALAGALICILISTVGAVVLQFFKGRVLDSAVAGNPAKTLSYSALLAVFILLEIGFFYGYRRLCARFSIGCARELKADIFQSILSRSHVRYREHPQGWYLAKYTNEADLIREKHFAMLPMLAEILLKVALVSAALFWLDFRIALVTLLLLTTPLYLPKLIEKRLQAVQAAYVRAAGESLARVTSWLAAFEVIKNFSIEQQIMKQFDAANGEAMDRLLADKQLGNLAQLITTLISYLSYFIIVAFAAWLVLAGDFSAGDFFVAVGMIDQLSYPLISLSGVMRQLSAIRPSCREMEAFVQAGKEQDARPGPDALQSAIRFEGVSFAYTQNAPVLAHFSLLIEKGKRYLLRGPSGCGKTTAINLLLRYYDADAGRILLDGVPINRYDTLYGLMTVVRQDVVLLHDTLRNNLTMYHEADDDDLMRLLAQLGLERFANRTALDALLEEGGANLSGGEKRRIGLARALLRNTEVLLVDEPLANLDETAARKIEALLLSITGKTLIVVSHQFSCENLAGFDAVVDM